MAVHTMEKTYETRGHMGMIDLTDEVKQAVAESGLSAGTITIYVAGCTAALTTLEYEPGLVQHDLKAALDLISPYRDEEGNVIAYEHHKTWGCDNGSSHIKAALLSPFITVPFVDGKLTIGPWQNYALVECDTRDRKRRVIFQVMGE